MRTLSGLRGMHSERGMRIVRITVSPGLLLSGRSVEFLRRSFQRPGSGWPDEPSDWKRERRDGGALLGSGGGGKPGPLGSLAWCANRTDGCAEYGPSRANILGDVDESCDSP